jgi:hypothetical protein
MQAAIDLLKMFAREARSKEALERLSAKHQKPTIRGQKAAAAYLLKANEYAALATQYEEAAMVLADAAAESFEPFGTEGFMPKVHGVAVRCHCGGNVFSKSIRNPIIYRCNSCYELYESQL